MNHRIKIILTIIALLITCHATAQITESKIDASDGSFDDFFGQSVSLSDDYAIVGAYGDNDAGVDAGSAYIFHNNGTSWVEQAKLVASDGDIYDQFGWSASISGDYAIVGAYGDDDNGSNAGSAYIFHYNGSGWVEHTKLTPNDGATNDYFGYSVAISGNYALVGAVYESNVNGNGAGAAYVFYFNGSSWDQQAKLIASDGFESDAFGRSVSIADDYAVVGAPYENENGPYAGSAYVFHRAGSTWTEEDKLIASDGFIGNYFGWSVSNSGDHAIVGALNAGGDGAAYMFHNNGSAWLQQVKLLASDGQIYDWFGTSVSIYGDYALVGTYGDDDHGDDAGSAYIYQYDGSNWLQQTKLLADDGSPYDQFGWSVSITDEHALVGAFWDDVGGENAGSAYAYEGFAVSVPGISCDEIRFFNAKCSTNGTVQGMVKLLGDWTGETITFDLDGDDYVINILSNGTNSVARLTVPHGGMGSHTVILEDPASCYPPVNFNCQVDAPPDPEWDALWAEYDVLEGQALNVLPTETRIIGQPVLGLAGNYPNPFNPSTTISYGLSEAGRVSLKVYNMLGQLVRTIVDEQQLEGNHEAVWDGRNEIGATVASGIYVYRMTAGNFVETKRMILMK